MAEALRQVGIDPTNVTKVRGEADQTDPDSDEERTGTTQRPARTEQGEAPAGQRQVDVAARDEAAGRISAALRKLSRRPAQRVITLLRAGASGT